MALTLRSYQVDLIDRVRVALRSHRSVVAQLATGGGKTALATKMLRTVSEKKAPSMFVVHRQELIDQTMRTFAEFDLPFGVISAGFTPAPNALIQIASIDTLRARLMKDAAFLTRRPRFVIWDECHHIAAAGWSFVKQQFENSQHVGLTATPERLDGKGLRGHFDHMECGPPMEWLIDNGYLSKYRAFMPSIPDLSRVHTERGDFVAIENEAAMDKPSITGDAVSHYLQHARGRRALAFCVSVKHSRHVVEQFNQSGIIAWHLDGTTNRGERRKAIAAFRRGEIKVLSNVDLFGEGFDVPAAECSIMLRPTKSTSLFLQQCGRVLRPLEGKAPAILLDHAGNLARHGFPDDHRDWTLDGRDKAKEEKAPVDLKTCPKCAFAHRVGPPHCPACGFAYQKKPRQVELRDGALGEVDVEAMRAARKREVSDAVYNAVRAAPVDATADEKFALSLDALIAIGKARGYKAPDRWAAYYLTARVDAAKRRNSL